MQINSAKFIFIIFISILIISLFGCFSSENPVISYETPMITSITPSSATYNSIVTINGQNFRENRYWNYVDFNGIRAISFPKWSDEEIQVRVPDSATTGKVSVHVYEKTSNPFEFTVIPAPRAVNIQMVSISSGTFQMGDINNNGANAGPVHEVVLSKKIIMSKYEITQDQYYSVMLVNPSTFRGSVYPVVNISWFDATEFCNKLSELTNLEPCYSGIGNSICNFDASGFRLPTEAEWEYACRAGKTTNYYTGDSLVNLDKAAWYSGNSGDSTHAVGKKTANALGLFDMHGNVWEWCWDWYDSDYYITSPIEDPQGPANSVAGTKKVIRGGSYKDIEDCSSWKRGNMEQNSRSMNVGFRVVRK
ncbi:MAG: hypothetical protein QG635_1944 [Bacteroidota bacterium]|nr:hypothetical protein [Bacteroidota bacterium]